MRRFSIRHSEIYATIDSLLVRDDKGYWVPYEDAAARITNLESQLVTIKMERDNAYLTIHDLKMQLYDLTKQLAEYKEHHKFAVDNWTLEAQNVKVAEERIAELEAINKG